MSASVPAKERIVHNLQDAIERLHEDLFRVELWADALGCFARPIPDYNSMQSNLNTYALPEAESASVEPSKPTAGEPRSGRKSAPIRGRSEG